MPPVESYQRIDVPNPQNTEESSLQINKKSIDQTRNEARIENHSVQDTIEDSVLSIGNVAAAGTTKDGTAAPQVVDAADKAKRVIDAEHELESKSTAAQFGAAVSEGMNDSVDDLTGNNEYYLHNVEKTGDQFSEVDSYFSDDDNDALRNHPGERVSDKESVMGADGGSKAVPAQESIKLEDDARIDSVDNLTIEQAFDFLTEQTEDSYVQPSAFVRKPTHSTPV